MSIITFSHFLWYSYNVLKILGSLKTPIPSLNLYLLYVNDLLDDVTCNTAIYSDIDTLASVNGFLDCGNRLWGFPSFRLTFKTVMLLVNLNAGKTKLTSVMMKQYDFLRCWYCPFIWNWIEVLTLSSLLKLTLRKMELLKFFLFIIIINR